MGRRVGSASALPSPGRPGRRAAFLNQSLRLESISIAGVRVQLLRCPHPSAHDRGPATWQSPSFFAAVASVQEGNAPYPCIARDERAAAGSRTANWQLRHPRPVRCQTSPSRSPAWSALARLPVAQAAPAMHTAVLESGTSLLGLNWGAQSAPSQECPSRTNLVCHCTSARLCPDESDEPRTGTSLQGVHARRTERQGSVGAESAPGSSEQRFRWQGCLHKSHPAHIHITTRYQMCRRCSVW